MPNVKNAALKRAWRLFLDNTNFPSNRTHTALWPRSCDLKQRQSQNVRLWKMVSRPIFSILEFCLHKALLTPQKLENKKYRNKFKLSKTLWSDNWGSLLSLLKRIEFRNYVVCFKHIEWIEWPLAFWHSLCANNLMVLIINKHNKEHHWFNKSRVCFALFVRRPLLCWSDGQMVRWSDEQTVGWINNFFICH